jgi:hypothetical protein
MIGLHIDQAIAVLFDKKKHGAETVIRLVAIFGSRDGDEERNQKRHRSAGSMRKAFHFPWFRKGKAQSVTTN